MGYSWAAAIVLHTSDISTQVTVTHNRTTSAVVHAILVVIQVTVAHCGAAAADVVHTILIVNQVAAGYSGTAVGVNDTVGSAGDSKT